MQIGDPKKAIVLAIVAIAVIGVAAFQLFPKASHLATIMRQASEGQAPPTAKPEDQRPLPDVVTSSPFRKLPPPVKPGTKPTPMAGTLAADSEGTKPYDSGFERGPDGVIHPIPGVNPSVENTGSGQQLEGKPGKAATLRAILRVQGRVAVFELQGFKNQRTKTLRAGAWLDNEYRVIEMTDRNMTLINRQGKEIKIGVGTTLNL